MRRLNQLIQRVPIETPLFQRAPLSKANLQTPQSYGIYRGEVMFEDSDEGADQKKFEDSDEEDAWPNK